MNALLLFIGGIGGPEVLLILAVILIFFGAKKIPELARGLGRGMREFKDATREITDEIDSVKNVHDKPQAKISTTSNEVHTNKK